MDLKTHLTAIDRGWSLRLLVSLERGETNELFLAGDGLISWPTEGMVSVADSGPVVRNSMFLSEIAARPDGLQLVMTTRDQADRAGRLIERQIRALFPEPPPADLDDADPEETDHPDDADPEEVDPIRSLLLGYLEMPGLIAAILVSDQGLAIHTVQSGPVETEVISALVADIAASALRFGGELGVGGLTTMTLEFERLELVVVPFGEELTLALVGQPGSFGATGGSAGHRGPATG